MRNVVFFRPFFIIAGVLFYFTSAAQTFSSSPSWREEFRYRGRPNENIWTCQIGKYSGELEYYTDSTGNVFVSNGKLHIVATGDRREDMLCSSGRINTFGKKSFLYGKLEIRAKTPVGAGIFPAIWMLREDHGKVYPLGEIDIMEYIDCFNRNQYCTTTHIVGKKGDTRFKHTSMIDADMTRFHIYSLEWTPNNLLFKLDGKEVYEVKKVDAEYWPFDSPYCLLLNVAFGGWGQKCGIDPSIFPKEMIIDWIRYYNLIRP